MLNQKLFHSTELLLLYNQGKLNHIFQQFKKEINEKTFLGCGAEASSFVYKNDQVLKICAKNIGYFKHQKSNVSAEQFMKDINHLQPYFLPVNAILYEDENLMIYTQYRCQPLSKAIINSNHVIEIFRLVFFMLTHNFLLSDLIPQNLALYKGRIVLFDYHSLHPFCDHKKECPKNAKWWRRLFKNLTRYLTLIYSPNDYSSYDKIFHHNKCSTLKSHDYLPHKFLELLRYVSLNQKNISKQKFLKLFETCIQFLVNDITKRNIEFLQTIHLWG